MVILGIDPGLATLGWGVIDALRKAGAGEGSVVRIGDMEFDFVE